VIVDWLRPERSTCSKGGYGTGDGFAGLALLVGLRTWEGRSALNPRGAAVLVIASLAWACGSLYSKHGGMPSSAMLGVAMQSLAGGVILLIAGLFAGEFKGLHLGAISPRSWLALGYLIISGRVSDLARTCIFCRRARRARWQRTRFESGLALFLGWLIAGESITLRTVIAAAVILTAVILVITAPHRKPVPVTAPVPTPGEA